MRALIIGLLMLTGGIAQAAEIPSDFKCRSTCERSDRDAAKLCYGPLNVDKNDSKRESVLIVDGSLFEGTTDARATKFTSDDGSVQAKLTLDASGKPKRIEVNGTVYEQCSGGFGEGSVTVHN